VADVTPNPRYPMKKQCIISIVVVFIVAMTLDFVVHAMLLKADYAAEPALMRTAADANRHFPALLLAHLIFAMAVTVIYQRGREAGKPWMGQGVRFGLWLALLACVPNFLIYYAVEPVGLMVACKQIVFGGIATVVVGIVAAALNQAQPAA
jgi:hypothetical protein